MGHCRARRLVARTALPTLALFATLTASPAAAQLKALRTDELLLVLLRHAALSRAACRALLRECATTSIARPSAGHRRSRCRFSSTTSTITATPRRRACRRTTCSRRWRRSVTPSRSFPATSTSTGCSTTSWYMSWRATWRPDADADSAPALSRQGLPEPGATAVDVLELPRLAASLLAAVVSRGHRELHGDLDGRRPRARPERLRRDGVPHHGRDGKPIQRPARIRDCGHHRRLPGRRQRLSLRHPLHEPPRPRVRAREADRLGGAHRGQRAVLLAPVRAAVRCCRWSDAWADWIAAESERQRANLERLRQNPITAAQPHRRAGARLGVAACPRSRPGAVYLGVSYPGKVAAPGATRSRERQAHEARRPERRGALLGDLDRARPESQTLFFVTDNNTCAI